MSFGDAWRNANDDDFDPADGSYHVKVIDASAFSGRDGREWAKVVLQIIGTDAAGRQFDHFMNLNNPTGLRIAKESLITYGLDDDGIDDLDDLSRAMFELIGTEADVTVGHKDGFRNVNVQGSRTGQSDVTAPGAADSDFSKPPPAAPVQQSFAAAAAGDDDDVPF
jgi:hypothetical protein